MILAKHLQQLHFRLLLLSEARLRGKDILVVLQTCYMPGRCSEGGGSGRGTYLSALVRLSLVTSELIWI